jgi:ketosteroid isomerase-like protein
MPAEVPRVIAAYVAASNDYDADALIDCFTADAVVHDEGHDRRGTAEIAAWREEVTRKYSPRMVVTEAREEGGRTIVTGQVSGNFPGSPVTLRYGFTLADGRIARLDIG